MKEEDDKGKRPPPTTANPAPPELIPDTKEAIAVCTSPDICRSPTKEVPYQAWARADDDRNYAASVRSNGDIIKHRQSRIHRTRGDEGGVGLGCCSNTVEDKVKPVTSSPVVKATGHPVQRDGDRCTLNRGNTGGEYVHHKCDLTHPAPDGQDEQDKRPWYKQLDDWAGEKLSSAGKAINEFDQNNFKVVTRGVGLLQAAGGLGEMVVGGGLMGVGGAASTTGVGAVPGVPAMIGGGLLFGSGLDNGGTGLKQLWTGETQTTMTARAAGAAATAMGATPETAQKVENVAGMVQGAAGGGGAAIAAGSRMTRAVESGAVGARSTLTVTRGSYKDLKRTLKDTDEQANHLNQDAAFRDKIPTNDGAANGMRGNAFTDVGSPHYEFHNSLEGFWNNYRQGGALEGTLPTVSDYDGALRNALGSSGYSPSQVDDLANFAAGNRAQYGIQPGDLVPRVPGRINQSR